MGLGQSTFAQWVVILGLIFGGCCRCVTRQISICRRWLRLELSKLFLLRSVRSNAWALELVTSQNPRAGSFLTFAQFLLVTAVSLPKQLHVLPPRCTRQELLHHVASAILTLRKVRGSNGILKVAIDGVDGAGKTTFADELAEHLRSSPSSPNIIRASVDGFHNPPEVRHKRGRNSPEGFYRDSYNYDSLRENLLYPLSSGGTRRYVQRVYDVDASAPVPPPTSGGLVASEGDILVFDGIFLHRAELREFWDLSVFLDVPFEVSTRRGAQRSAQMDPDPNSENNRRYVEGQKLYLDEAGPAQRASILVDYTSLTIPVIQRSSFPFPPHNSLLSRVLRTRMKRPAVPLVRWLVQVALFFLLSGH